MIKKTPKTTLPPQRPAPLSVAPIWQEDGYSCGACALRALYRFHKIRGAKWWIERQLGVHESTPLLPERLRRKAEKWFEKWGWDFMGSWPPDVFALLRLDGFKTTPLSFEITPRLRDKFDREIAKGNPMLCLTGSGIELHWLLLTGTTDRGPVFTCSGLGRWAPDWEYFRNHTGAAISIPPGVETKKLVRSRTKENVGSRPYRSYLRGWEQGFRWSCRYLGASVPTWIRNWGSITQEIDDSGDDDLPPGFVWDDEED